MGEEVNTLGGEYIAAVLWIANDAGSGGVKPTKNNNNNKMKTEQTERSEIICEKQSLIFWEIVST